jgi:hypothetical protein
LGANCGFVNGKEILIKALKLGLSYLDPPKGKKGGELRDHA